MTDIQDTLAERGARYGDFTDHAAIAQRLQDVMRDSGAVHVADETFMSTNKGWNALSPVKRQALSVIADKIARILSGDPEYRDNWHDIAEYATLAHDRCVDTDGPQLPLKKADDGWIDWDGGKCPVTTDKRVKYRLRNGDNGSVPHATALCWAHDSYEIEPPYEVAAYKVVE